MKPAEASTYRNLIESSVVFQGLPPQALETITQRGLLLEAKQDDLVYFENMPGGIGLYVVLEGKVAVFRSNADQAVLNTLLPGHCFGEYSLLDGQATSASARALESTRLFFLPRGELLQLTDRDHEAGKLIYHNLLLYLIKRLRQKDEVSDPRR